jgi:hypothetical protein
MDVQNIYQQIADLTVTLAEEHESHQAGNKAAGRRARKAAGEIKKLITPYKQASVSDDKN